MLRQSPGKRMLKDLALQLEEVERRVGPTARVWQREWAAMAWRGSVIELAKIEELDPSVKGEVEAQRVRWSVIRTQIDRMDAEEIGPLQERLRRREYSAADFRAELARRPPYERDAFVERLLGIADVPTAELQRATHMNKYQPTPVSVILEIVEQVTPGEVLYDLGCGLGKVTLLAGWLGPALSIGVEFDPAYSRVAENRAREFGFDRVRLITSDVRDLDYSDGDFFYFFFPFDGEIMRAVLDRISSTTRGKKIRIGSLGKCTQAFVEEPWLEQIHGAPSGFTVFGNR